MQGKEERKSKLEAALEYAQNGWPVLPLKGKLPLTKHGYKDASCNAAQIKKWWKQHPAANIGIVAGDSSGLLVLDIDIKNGHCGDQSLRELEQQFAQLPKTLKAKTPSGGWHLWFRLAVKKIKKIADVRDGIDLLANGSYFVAPPSTIDGKSYQRVEKCEIALCPDWVLALTKPQRVTQATAVNPRIADLVRELFPSGKESNGNWVTLCPYHDESNPSFAIKLDDGRFICYTGKCAEQGSFAKLYAKMKNVSEHEARIMLRPIPPFIEGLNREHAIIKVGGNVDILTEEIDPVEGWKNITFSSKASFLLQYQPRTTIVDGKPVQIAQIWLNHPARRQYRGVVFAPGLPISKEYYNLWQGFGITRKQGDCSLMLKHILENACRGDVTLNRYMVTWMAQAVQEPWNRPGIALVFRGKQGTGKGILCTQFGALFGRHFSHISTSRHLVGNFNADFKESLIVFADEAYWAGDKASEGQLKALITEKSLKLEYKGKDVVRVRNYIRLMFATNHDWAVPAGLEERRFCVIDIGETHMQDTTYFEALMNQMDSGGREAFLDYLLSYDISTVNLRKLPQTQGLIDTKLLTFLNTQRFWLEILERGTLMDGVSSWHPLINKESLYRAYILYAQDEKSWAYSKIAFWMHIKKLAPHGRDVTDNGKRCWEVGDLQRCRAAVDRAMSWSNHIWEAPEVDEDIPPLPLPAPPSKLNPLEEYDWDKYKVEEGSAGGGAAASV